MFRKVACATLLKAKKEMDKETGDELDQDSRRLTAKAISKDEQQLEAVAKGQEWGGAGARRLTLRTCAGLKVEEIMC